MPRLGHAALPIAPSRLWIYGGLTSGVSVSASAAMPAHGDSARDSARVSTGGVAWLLELPNRTDEAVDACLPSVATAAQDSVVPLDSTAPAAAACSAHGTCDLSWRRCVCEPPWDGPTCAVAASADMASSVDRGAHRLVAGVLWFALALLGGAVAGWLERHRTLMRDRAQRAREKLRAERLTRGAE